MAKIKKKVIPLTPVKAEERFYDPQRDGVTQGLLSKFLTCREKARLFLKGWTSAYPSFALVYGSVVHAVLQRAYHEHMTKQLRQVPDRAYVRRALDDIWVQWKKDNPRPHEKAVAIMEETMMKAGAILPTYFAYWAKDDFSRVRWLEIEESFRLEWEVQGKSGKHYQTFLRGKIDGAFTAPGKKHGDRPRLLETKTRAVVDEANLVDSMPHERQVNLYLMALRRKLKLVPRSVLMNVIRKTALRQKQKETWDQYTKRIEVDVQSRLEFYFIRMEMVVEEQDINRAEAELNDLIADFLLWYAGESGHYKNSDACVQPGFGRCEYLGVCSRGDYHGLIKRNKVFRELEDE